MSNRFGPRIHALGSAFNSRVAQWNQRSLVKSIQRGTITLNGVTSNTATITSVKLTDAVIRFLGVQNVTTAANADTLDLRVELTNATTVTAYVNTAGAADHIAGFEVIEYWPGVIRLVQRGTVAISGASSGTATITAVNTATAELGYLGLTTTATDFRGIESIARVVLTNATTVTANVGGSITATVGYQVVAYY